MSDKKPAEPRLSFSEWWNKRQKLFEFVFFIVRVLVYALEKMNKIPAFIAWILNLFH